MFITTEKTSITNQKNAQILILNRKTQGTIHQKFLITFLHTYSAHSAKH